MVPQKMVDEGGTSSNAEAFMKQPPKIPAAEIGTYRLGEMSEQSFLALLTLLVVGSLKQNYQITESLIHTYHWKVHSL